VLIVWLLQPNIKSIDKVSSIDNRGHELILHEVVETGTHDMNNSDMYSEINLRKLSIRNCYCLPLEFLLPSCFQHNHSSPSEQPC